MTKFIALVSERQEVGKTLLAVNLAYALQKRGRKVLLLDGSGEGHLFSHLGAEGLNKPISEHLKNGKVENAITAHHSGLGIISLGKEEKLIPELFEHLDGRADYVLVEAGNLPSAALLNHCQECFLIFDKQVNEEKLNRKITLLEQAGCTILGLVGNKLQEKMTKQFVYPIISQIPFDSQIFSALEWHMPAVQVHPGAAFSKEVEKLAYLLTGER